MTSARDFTLRLAGLLRSERHAMADFLLALADFDRRRLWLELGHSSLFYFLHRELGLSKGAAFYRKTAAELIQRFPDIVEPLRDGRLCLTSAVELSKVLTPENLGEVLPRFFHVSKQEAKAVSAEMRPDYAAPHREVVTAVRSPVTVSSVARAQPVAELVVHPANQPCASAPRAEPPAEPPPRHPSPATEPLTADLNRLHVTVSRRFLAKLDAARSALSHSHPGAGAREILEAGLDLLIERHDKRKGLAAKPRREPPPAKPGHVPAHVKRAVWKRDEGRCQWRLDGGGVCGSTHKVELDHVVPKGRGGPPTIENMRLLCRVHNEYAARQVYGDDWMDEFTRKRAGVEMVGSGGQ